jgi:hypothetical protein
MGLESTTTIQGLDATFPTSGDPRSQGDDHLRLIKTVLKAMFPGPSGLGMTTPITAKEADLNSIFTTGTKSVFYQAAAPTGWTISNPGTNYTLVSAAVGGTIAAGNGDVVTGCNIFPDHYHTQQGTFGTSAVDLTHSHTLNNGITPFVGGGGTFNGTGGGTITNAARSVIELFNTSNSPSLNHAHTVTIGGTTTFASTSGFSTGIWQPANAKVIICLKS